jgi:hypothetical protein
MRIFTCFALAMLSQCVLSPLCGQLPYTACEPYPLSGTTVAMFDWRSPSYTFHMEGQTGAAQVTSPFWLSLAPAQENVSHLSGAPQDFEPSDGWELVLVNFGTPTKKVETPTLVLYNRLNGIMRVFQYAKGDITTYQSAALGLSQYIDLNAFRSNSSVLEHMNTPMNALDNFAKGVSIDFPNKYYNFVAGSSNRTWLFGEFVTAYDPCSCSHATGIRVQPRFAGITAIDLNIAGQGSTVPVYTPSRPRHQASVAISGAGDVVSTVAQGGKTYKDIGEFQNFLEDLDIGISGSGLDIIGTAIKMLDLLIKNGRAPSIASYDSEFVFEATGTLTKEDMADVSLFKTPGGLSLANIPPGIETGQTIYDAPLGLFNLLNTPKVQTYYEITSADVLIEQYKLDDSYDPQYVFNQAAGFSIDPRDVRFQLVFDDCSIDNPALTGLSPTGIPGRYATPLMPIACLKDYTINFLYSGSSVVSTCNSLPRLKVVANVKHDDLASATVYAASYNVGAIEVVPDPLPPNPYLNIK